MDKFIFFIEEGNFGAYFTLFPISEIKMLLYEETPQQIEVLFDSKRICGSTKEFDFSDFWEFIKNDEKIFRIDLTENHDDEEDE